MNNNIFKYFNIKELEKFGSFYKIRKEYEIPNDSKSNLILVTSINPTPEGEGKTTTLIGINDCLNYYGKDSIACLRQPSMGPYFGIKGGATGSGRCEIQNPEKINCGFTGDFYAIEAANNLIMSVIENEIYFNSELNIDPRKIIWKRCIDINDRSLRNINYQISKKDKVDSSFTITAASYLMALFCLAKNKKDFKERLEKTIVAFNSKNKPIYVQDLNITDSIMLILDDALKPNLAFSKENNPIIIHGGPFANIAHGCNSVIALSAALNKSEYVLTEAGFGSELGAEKFINILCRETNLIPSLVVLTITLKAVKYHGSFSGSTNTQETIDNGFQNVVHHFNLLKKYGLNVCIVINKFSDDNPQELDYLYNKSSDLTTTVISTMWQDGSSKNEELYKTIINSVNKPNKIEFTYSLKEEAMKKINKLCTEIYNASSIKYSVTALSKLQENEHLLNNYYICGAKTPYSPSIKNEYMDLEKHDVIVEDIEINHASKFIIPIFSKTFLMPGLPKEPNAKKIKINFDKFKYSV